MSVATFEFVELEYHCIIPVQVSLYQGLVLILNDTIYGPDSPDQDDLGTTV
jgi:hypothetical protein